MRGILVRNTIASYIATSRMKLERSKSAVTKMDMHYSHVTHAVWVAIAIAI